jgi:hypothetical protein
MHIVSPLITNREHPVFGDPRCLVFSKLAHTFCRRRLCRRVPSLGRDRCSLGADSRIGIVKRLYTASALAIGLFVLGSPGRILFLL